MAENSDRQTDRPDALALAQTIRDALYVLVQKGSEDRAAQALDALDNLLNENKRLLEQITDRPHTQGGADGIRTHAG